MAHVIPLALTLVMAAGQDTSPRDRVIGLLTLPEVFGSGACDRFQPGEVILYSSPDGSRSVGRIRVDKHWSFAPQGGCAGLEVGVHHASGQTSSLPFMEHDYEAPAAIVLEERTPWFRIRLADDTAWVRASHRDEYHPLARLLADSLNYLTPAWDGRLAASPGGEARAIERPSKPGENTAVNVVGFREPPEGLWVEVEVYSYSPCIFPAKPLIIARGWTPAHAPSGKLAVWFYSRGC